MKRDMDLIREMPLEVEKSTSPGGCQIKLPDHLDCMSKLVRDCVEQANLGKSGACHMLGKQGGHPVHPGDAWPQ